MNTELRKNAKNNFKTVFFQADKSCSSLKNVGKSEKTQKYQVCNNRTKNDVFLLIRTNLSFSQ